MKFLKHGSMQLQSSSNNALFTNHEHHILKSSNTEQKE
jgi:hypothetical protein